ncbi:bile acid:sodium symporter family protein [Dyadobacter psychrophilus]|uniref:Solute carrier family 10 (Sodium/bile acid cotransporter), member 7 n=1 Tax=Dyadobacter psychrophilus TaxID=651661 RepID=A0A1T5CGR3_9BACT|nr:bile acid:sodium symporter family protein [Dyadobacter psychrophilus]SKB58682.1 solute carrier family 10 (sodium/bile acid cotransporter), member 7 [Dyadobacter psychrophilus]
MSKIFDTAKKAGLDGFMLALLAMIFLAWLWPYPGMKESPVPLSDISSVAVSIIFFFYGLRLSPEKLGAGLVNWKLHVMVHLSTFILFPLLALAFRPLFNSDDSQTLWLAIFFLTALPSTVSSSVIMVSIAKGNVPAAIFNASISSLIGVFITPLWMGLVMDASSGQASQGHFDLLSVVGKLSLQVLLPVCAGIALNKRWGHFAEQHKKYIRYFDQSSILLIVYTSFCESFGEHLFSSLGLKEIVFLGIGMLTLFFGIYFLLTFISNLLHFNHEDRVTAVFCGSKKSLVQGAVMSKVLFPGAQAGLMLLPIMIYHALQLIAASIIAQRMAARLDEDEARLIH